MKLTEALEVRVGDTLASPHDTPEYKPRKVTDVWVNEARTIVRFQLVGSKGLWYASQPFVRVATELGYHWSQRAPSGWRDANNRPITFQLINDPEEE